MTSLVLSAGKHAFNLTGKAKTAHFAGQKSCLDAREPVMHMGRCHTNGEGPKQDVLCFGGDLNSKIDSGERYG